MPLQLSIYMSHYLVNLGWPAVNADVGNPAPRAMRMSSL